jgi:VanZ family protein
MPVPANSSPLGIFLIKYWLPVIIYAIIIFSASSIPGKAIPPIFKYQDVVFHFTEYAFLSLFLSRALKAGGVLGHKRFYWVFILCLLYALSDEWHQSFVPGRVASLYDIVVDGLGAFVAGIIHLWRR